MGLIPFLGGKKAGRERDGREAKGRSNGKEAPNRYQKPKSDEKPARLRKLGGLGRLFKGCIFAGLILGVFFFIGIGLAHCYNFFVNSEYFRLKTIEISGNSRLKSREVLDIVELTPGVSNTLAVSIDAMEAALARNPWVGGLSIKRTLPDRFAITVTEREPKYWVNRGGILYYADAAGAPIMPVSTHGFSSLPALEIEPGAEAQARRLPELVSSLAEADLPLDIASSAWLRLSAGGALELRPNDKLLVSLGIADWARHLEHLDKVLQDLSRRGELRSVAEIKVHGGNVWVTRRSGS
ncbi:MAG: FtsQ-type POTRA domain-containing protein [Deltaproteobacteria bacterium]|jgi:cell division protein FtsQ|nr:FtsQ-type POTRA domain-containing protein [Deltaproteobacteria bacterium]